MAKLFLHPAPPFRGNSAHSATSSVKTSESPFVPFVCFCKKSPLPATPIRSHPFPSAVKDDSGSHRHLSDLIFLSSSNFAAFTSLRLSRLWLLRVVVVNQSAIKNLQSAIKRLTDF